jgi:hypothetical protein
MKERKRNVIGTISYPEDFEPVMQGFRIVAARERKSVSELMRDVIEQYVKVHGEGNPSYELSKWVDQPEFIGDPAVREDNRKWDRYLEQCDMREIEKLETVFMSRVKQCKDEWSRKYRTK